MRTPITQAEFSRQLAEFQHSAYRFEAQPTYKLGYEQTEFTRFLEGSPVPPPDVAWWRPWLEQITALTEEGKTVSRVRVLEVPPTPYQRWELWAASWHAEAGEDIRYLTRPQAHGLGLPLKADWWLLDDERLIVIHYTSSGAVKDKELVTDKGLVALHSEWRSLARHHAIPAAEIAAA